MNPWSKAEIEDAILGHIKIIDSYFTKDEKVITEHFTFEINGNTVKVEMIDFPEKPRNNVFIINDIRYNTKGFLEQIYEYTEEEKQSELKKNIDLLLNSEDYQNKFKQSLVEVLIRHKR